MKLAVALMVRNEADSYLESALDAWSHFADLIIALDDGSTDGTLDLLFRYTPRVRRTLGKEFWKPAWGNEWRKRQELWSFAHKYEFDYLFFLDADMVPLCDPTPLLQPGVDGVAFALYDLWDQDGTDLFYREDNLWRAHAVPRLWCIRRRGDLQPEWNQRGIHCGHLPTNLTFNRIVIAPKDFSILHYGYLDSGLRESKQERYLAVGDQLTEDEAVHAASITDPAPKLVRLPYRPSWPLEKPRSS